MTPAKKKKITHATKSFCHDFLVDIALVVTVCLVTICILQVNNSAFLRYLENSILQTPYAGTTENESSDSSLSILIDEELRSSFCYEQIIDSGYRFVIVDSIDFVPPESPLSDAIGLTDYQAKCIYITPTLNYKNVVHHEIGHWIDDRLNTISGSTDFEDIFAAEKDAFNSISSNQAVESSSEMFAEAYALLVGGKPELHKKAPRTYEFVKEAAYTISVAKGGA